MDLAHVGGLCLCSRGSAVRGFPPVEATAVHPSRVRVFSIFAHWSIDYNAGAGSGFAGADSGSIPPCATSN
jgi:hypothetical protein